MRLLAAALVVFASLSFVSLTAEPAAAMQSVCVDESGRDQRPDLYNNVGWTQTSDCDGMVCYNYYSNYGYWRTCVPPTIYCTTATGIVPCGPPVVIDLDDLIGPCTCPPPQQPYQLEDIIA